MKMALASVPFVSCQIFVHIQILHSQLYNLFQTTTAYETDRLDHLASFWYHTWAGRPAVCLSSWVINYYVYMGSRAVVETISYFLRNGSEVFGCTMDMTKAFDLVKHSILFRKLWIKGLSVIFLRLLLFIYMMQMANVKWNGEISSQFSLGNGVRQGGVISAILYCFYVNDLFTLLRQRGEGCWVQGTFCRIYGYSDDNFLLAPSLHALQCMIDTCEEYAEAHNLKFSADPDPVKFNTKCLAFTTRKR